MGKEIEEEGGPVVEGKQGTKGCNGAKKEAEDGTEKGVREDNNDNADKQEEEDDKKSDKESKEEDEEEEDNANEESNDAKEDNNKDDLFATMGNVDNNDQGGE